VSTIAISNSRAACGVHEVKAAGRRADLIHVDLMHDHLVPPFSIGPVVAACLRRRAARSPHALQLVSAKVRLGAA
jgi:pentose-5-phosphate-3-epimerase